MNTKVTVSAKTRMNALLQLALIKADQHRPECAQCYKIANGQAFFYFESEEGKAVGVEERELMVNLSDNNTSIIADLVREISEANGIAEHRFRKQVRDSARTALNAFPTQRQSILRTVFSFA